MRSLVLVSMLLAIGCASSPHASLEFENQAKLFASPGADRARVYIYRRSIFAGDAELVDLWIDGEMAGSIGPREFLAVDIEPGTHAVSLRHVGIPSAVRIEAPAGRVSFFTWTVALVIKPVDDETGRKHVSKYRMAWSPMNGEEALGSDAEEKQPDGERQKKKRAGRFK